MTKLHEHAKLIEAMGNAQKVAQDLGLERVTVQLWKNRGIPARFQLDNQKWMKKARKAAQM